MRWTGKKSKEVQVRETERRARVYSCDIGKEVQG
jgi:hypothetical protein